METNLLLSDALSKFVGTNIFVTFEPEVLDFTDTKIPTMILHGQNGQVVQISLKDDLLLKLIPMLKLSVFVQNHKVIAWNWKNFISYVLAKTGKTCPIEAALIDLKVIESLAGRRLKCPKTFNESVNRVKDLVQTGLWKEVEPVYKAIQIPLITTVIPHLETTGINSVAQHKRLYAYYEIDGQENGRLKCSQFYKDGYVPHAMKPEFRESLKTRCDSEFFMVFDFRGMEVFMLAHLSKDPLLLELCKANDIYSDLYEKIIEPPTKEKKDREIAKKMFLPVIYGQSAYALSQRCGLSIENSELAIQKIHSLFPTALSFIESYQKQLAEHGYVKDIFNRRRSNFPEGKEYAVRNFAIQSPAAIVCLEKLNHLYFALKDKTDIAYTIHDGYVVYATKDNLKTIKKIAFDVLSGESDVCPGLRLRVTCRAGRNLEHMKSLAS